MQKRVSQVPIYKKNVQKHAKLCKIVQNCAKTCKIVQKRASQIFLDPIQKSAPARSVQLEAMYLETLMYVHFDLCPSEIYYEANLGPILGKSQ